MVITKEGANDRIELLVMSTLSGSDIGGDRWFL